MLSMYERFFGKSKPIEISLHQKKCSKYESSNRRIINKRRKIAKHLKKHPNDTVSQLALEGLS